MRLPRVARCAEAEHGLRSLREHLLSHADGAGEGIKVSRVRSLVVVFEHRARLDREGVGVVGGGLVDEASCLTEALRAALRAPGGHVRGARSLGVGDHLVVLLEIFSELRALLEVLARVPVVAGALVGLGALLPRDHGLLSPTRLLELGGCARGGGWGG